MNYVLAKGKVLTSSILLGICCLTEIKANFIQDFKTANGMIEQQKPSFQIAEQFINGFNKMKSYTNEWWDTHLSPEVKFQWKSSSSELRLTPYGYRQTNCPIVLPVLQTNSYPCIFTLCVFNSMTFNQCNNIFNTFIEDVLNTKHRRDQVDLRKFSKKNFCEPVAKLLKTIVDTTYPENLDPKKLNTIGALYRCYDQINDSSIYNLRCSPQKNEIAYNEVKAYVNDFFVNCYTHWDQVNQETKEELISLLRPLTGQPSDKNLDFFNLDLNYFFIRTISQMPILTAMKDPEFFGLLMEAADKWAKTVLDGIKIDEKEYTPFFQNFRHEPLLWNIVMPLQENLFQDDIPFSVINKILEDLFKKQHIRLPIKHKHQDYIRYHKIHGELASEIAKNIWYKRYQLHEKFEKLLKETEELEQTIELTPNTNPIKRSIKFIEIKDEKEQMQEVLFLHKLDQLLTEVKA